VAVNLVKVTLDVNVCNKSVIKNIWTALYCSTNRNTCCQRNIRFLLLSGSRNVLVGPHSLTTHNSWTEKLKFALAATNEIFVIDGKVLPDSFGTLAVTTVHISKSVVQVLQHFGCSLLCLQQETENRRDDMDINRFELYS